MDKTVQEKMKNFDICFIMAKYPALHGSKEGLLSMGKSLLRHDYIPWSRFKHILRPGHIFFLI